MKRKILILGGGIMGLSVSRDLALRGFEVILVEKSKIGSGTTTKCAGMLHSGARYAVKDPKVAKLCHNENIIMQSIASFAVGSKKALFITLPEDDPDYYKQFESNCSKLGIKIEKLSKEQALELEPSLNNRITGAYITPDVVIDTFRLVEGLSYDNQKRGVCIAEDTILTNIKRDSIGWDIELKSPRGVENIYVDLVINATGDSIAEIAKMFDEELQLNFIHGTMAVLDKPTTKRIISRCALSTVGDVIVPLIDGTLIGSTWHEIDDNKPINMDDTDIENLHKSSELMLENGRKYKIVSSFTGIRTHIKNDTSEQGDFNIKRDFSVYVHKNKNLISVLPGKLTTARHVAEKVGDEVAQLLKIDKKSNSSQVFIDHPDQFKKSKIKFYVN